MSKAKQASTKAYPISSTSKKNRAIQVGKIIAFRNGYKQAEKEIIAIIETRLSELLGDAQPMPVLRHELQDLIKKIKEEK